MTLIELTMRVAYTALVITLLALPLPFTTLLGRVQAGSVSYELVWSEEFNGDRVDESTWNFNIGNGCPNLCFWGNNELQYYKKDNAFVENGYLVIEARREVVVDPVMGRVHEYTSARLDTIGKFKFQYGRIEVRAKLPSGRGIWPAVWMLGEEWSLENARAWPSCGEIDIVELIGSEPNTVYGTVHTPFCYGARGVSSHFTLPRNKTFSDDFHLFAVEWTSEYIAWFVDEQLYHVITRREMEARGCTWVFDKPFHIVLNIAVGGYWPGPPDNTTVFPARMYVDYIRIYRVKPNALLSRLDESDNELLARGRGFPRNVTGEVLVNWDFADIFDKYNVEFSNPDTWYLHTTLPDLVNLEKTRVVGGVLELVVTNTPTLDSRVVLGQYVWLYQNRTYLLELRVWSSCNTTLGLHVKLPVRHERIYLEVVLETTRHPRVYRVWYWHGTYAGNVVEVGVKPLPSMNPECGDAIVFYVDYIKLEPVLDKSGELYATPVVEVVDQVTEFETISKEPEKATGTASQVTPEYAEHTIPAFIAVGVLVGLVLVIALRRARQATP